MKKLNCKTSIEISDLILKAMKLDVRTEDRSYEIKPIKWYLKTPWFGMKPFYYTGEAVDCDDFNTILKYEWLKRHIKKACAGPQSGGSWPALPVFQAKIQLVNGNNHWVMCVVAKEGVYLVERTEDTVRLVNQDEYVKIYRMHI